MDEGLLGKASDHPPSECPISRYNYFLRVYNQESNRVGGI